MITDEKLGQRGWIGVDLDGTLATFGEWLGVDSIGDPVPKMVARVRQWLSEDKEVRIVTARVSRPGEEGWRALIAIQNWCQKHLGAVLPVTCKKDFAMIELWDDRAIQIIPNTGRRVDGEDRIHALEQALREIMEADGPGADLSPGGLCYEIAKRQFLE